MSRGDDELTPPPLFDEAQSDTIASPGDVRAPIEHLPTDRLQPLIRKISERGFDRGLEEVDVTGEFSRIDTLPDGFAELLKRRQLQAGDVVGNRYRLLEVLGNGAMGQVFAAENQAIGVKVAVKVLKPEILANPEFRQRFQYEAQAVGSIEHPNVARFLDLVVGDPTFLVMEYVRGETLSSVIARGKLPVDRAVHIATRLAWGLDAAHAKGIIHRDLKPANVILGSDRETGEMPKLIDFGLAKIAAVAATEQLTRTGQIIGTPAYMSPEQISGREVDARSDVYALACLLYELIAGRPPFHGSDDVQTLYRQLHEPPEPLSLNAHDISAQLDRVMNRALAKDPANRYSSMQELARALAGAVERRRGNTDAIRVVPAGRRAWTWPALTALLTAALVAALFQWRRHHQRPVEAAAAGTLIVTSRPPGAHVSVDGKDTGDTTPAVVSTTPGKHVVALALPGRTPIEQHTEVERDGRALIEATLPPGSRAVRIESVPEGALVYLDGVLQIGQTPLAVTVSDDGFHQVRLEKPGFEMASKGIAPDDKAPSLSMTLLAETQGRGSLLLDSDIVADVWIDDAPSGFVSPAVLRLPAGDHTIQLRESDEPRSPTVKVKIKVGGATHLSLNATHG